MATVPNIDRTIWSSDPERRSGSATMDSYSMDNVCPMAKQALENMVIIMSTVNDLTCCRLLVLP